MSSDGGPPSSSESEAPNETPTGPGLSAQLRASSSEKAYAVTPLGALEGLYTLAEALVFAADGYEVRDGITGASVDVRAIPVDKPKEETKKGDKGKDAKGQDGPKGDGGPKKDGSGSASGGAGVTA